MIFIFRILLFRVFCSGFISSSIHNHTHIHMIKGFWYSFFHPSLFCGINKNWDMGGKQCGLKRLGEETPKDTMDQGKNTVLRILLLMLRSALPSIDLKFEYRTLITFKNIQQYLSPILVYRIWPQECR